MGARAVPALIAALTPRGYGYRAAMILTEMGAPHARPAIPVLTKYARTSTAHFLHLWSARALGVLGELDTVFALVKRERTQYAAVVGLAMARPASYRLLDELLDRKDAKLTELIANELRPGMAAYEPASREFPLVAAAAASKHEVIRKDVAIALSSFARGTDKARAVPVLASMLTDRSPEVRRLAALNLGFCRGHARGAVDQLKPLLKDRVKKVRETAKDAIAEIAKRRPGT
ncbi:MAG: HEAT repeat domain-containing protein [Myxococcota bacterium]|nr:HEAT repeat domain-containing protein [Myxococcota bacterium]